MHRGESTSPSSTPHRQPKLSDSYGTETVKYAVSKCTQSLNEAKWNLNGVFCCPAFLTESAGSGYFEHRRRDVEERFTDSDIAWLILKYDCHFNVEFSTGVNLFL
jgi:hypothetical protein